MSIEDLQAQIATLTNERDDAQRENAALAKEALELEDDREYNAELVRERDAEIARLRAENERLLAGKFTAEEVHGICHNLHGAVDVHGFADGCAVEQMKLYGRVPDRERIQAIREEQEATAARLAQLQEEGDEQKRWTEYLSGWVNFNRGKGTSYEAWCAYDEERHQSSPVRGCQCQRCKDAALLDTGGPPTTDDRA